jgi:apolipoprotein N-acyltransferase
VLAYPRAAALAAGVISATGFAPLSLWPLTIAAYALLFGLIARAASWQRALLIGWLFGLGQFTLGNNWIATAFTYQAAMPAWLGWIAVVALAIYLAIYPGLATLGAWWLARKSPLPLAGGAGGGRETKPALQNSPPQAPPASGRGFQSPGWSLVLVFAAMWIVTEWLRSWVFTGFVWNPLGVALVAPGLADASALLGTYGLGGVVVLAAGAAWLLTRGRWRDALMPGMLAAALMIGGFAYRAAAPDAPSPAAAAAGRPIAITVVQPNIPQETKADPAYDAVNWTKLARLSPTRQPGTPRVLLWPEAAIPDFLEDGYPLRYYDMVNLGGASAAQSRARLASLLAPGDLLVTGSADLEIGGGPGGAHAIGARNSVTVLTPEARIVGSADKAHLVPYGEYLPMRPLLSAIGLSRLVPGDLDFWPGPGARTLDLPRPSGGSFGKMGVQICYEIIFSGQVVDRANRPDFIFNPSNDAWFGAWGPPQQFAQGRLRAIEEGLPVVRATPTGISGIIDADGRVVDSLALGTAGRIDAALPPPHAPTVFARHGNIVPLLFALLLLLVAVAGPAVTARRKP